MTADIVIRGGTVVDGSGAPGRRADVAITGDRISDIGVALTGDRVLDATGQIVAPGFIDIHTHYDAQVFWDPNLTPSCFHGVTSVIAGNCGFSVAPCRPEHRDLIIATLERVEDMNPATLRAGVAWEFETFPEYLAAVARRGTVLNFGSFLAHSALRIYVMGEHAYEREATPGELEAMCRVLHDAMSNGALGFASSLSVTHLGANGKPVPSRFAAREEFMELGSVLRDMSQGVILVSGPGDQLPLLWDLARETGRPVTWGSIHSASDGSHVTKVEAVREARRDGLQLWPQITNTPMRFELTMADPFPLNPSASFAALMDAPPGERLRSYADPAFRRAATAEVADLLHAPIWETWEVVESRDGSNVGRMLVDLAAAAGCNPLEAALDLAVFDELTTRFTLVIANNYDPGKDFLLNQDVCTLGLGDAGAHVGQLCDGIQPTDLLSKWVRERGSVPMEVAIRKLTGEHADIFDIPDRGYLRAGAFADVVVFDPETVAPGPIRRVHDFPAGGQRLAAEEAVGITHVLVNGTPTKVDGTSLFDQLPTRPGRVLTNSKGPRWNP